MTPSGWLQCRHLLWPHMPEWLLRHLHLILHTCLLHWSRYKIKESSLKGFLLWQLTDILDKNVLEIMKYVRSVSDCVKSWRAHCILVLLFSTVHRLYWLEPTWMKSLVVLRINLEWRRKLLWSGEEEGKEEEDVTPQIISPAPTQMENKPDTVRSEDSTYSNLRMDYWNILNISKLHQEHQWSRIVGHDRWRHWSVLIESWHHNESQLPTNNHD